MIIALTQWQLVGVVIGSIVLWHILLWISDRMDEIRAQMLFDRVNSDLEICCNIKFKRTEQFTFEVPGVDICISCDRSMINEEYVREIGVRMGKIARLTRLGKIDSAS